MKTELLFRTKACLTQRLLLAEKCTHTFYPTKKKSQVLPLPVGAKYPEESPSPSLQKKDESKQ
jgi:hypothetical protein